MTSRGRNAEDKKAEGADVEPTEMQRKVMAPREDECGASSASSVADERLHPSQRMSVGKVGVLCGVPDCVKYAKLKHLCVAHGGFRPCEVHGCNKKVASQNRCFKHGGGTKCKIDGCNKIAQSSGKGHCTRHAREYGVLPKLICKVPGCSDFRVSNFIAASTVGLIRTSKNHRSERNRSVEGGPFPQLAATPRAEP